MMFIDPEMRAYQLFEHKILTLCKSNWRFMEYEDRLSEAAYILIIALRRFSTNSGFFWQDYQDILSDHMQKLKTEYRNQTCWLSLNRPFRNKSNEPCNCTLLDLLIAREPDYSDQHVQRFLNMLPFRQQDILNQLLDGRSHRSVCRRMKMSSLELKERLQEIAEDFRDYSMFQC